MPKVTDTRRQRAAELLRLATNGPSTNLHFVKAAEGLSEKQRSEIEQCYRDGYRLWSESWVLPLLKQLVPELKPRKK